MTQIGLELVGVQKFYRSIHAVRGVTFEVTRGEFFSLLGPSGCGKTTTLRMIAGFVKPSTGQIILDGQDITHLPPEKRNMGMVFQNYAIFPHMRVFDNIAFGLQMRKESREEIAQKVASALEQVGLVGYENRFQRELSGGEQQRVALARVLVIEPKLLLLDEPLSALDKQLREEMKYWIKGLQSKLGITTLYVTHDQGEAMTLSDRIAVMNRGKIEQIGAPREIYEQPATRFVSSFIGESNTFQGQVISWDDKSTRVALNSWQIDAPALKDAYPGQPVLIIVRPESVLLGESAAQATGARLSGKVVGEVYQGAVIRYEIRLPGELRLVAESHNTGEREVYPLGADIPVGWSIDSSVLLPE